MKSGDLRRIVERTDWDNELIRQESKINAACWAIVAIAVIFFFGSILFKMALR